MTVKVCGMREADNIRELERLPFQWMGFIFYPRSKRYVDNVPQYLPLRQKRVGIFVDATEEFITEHVSQYGLHLLQLHGHETPADCHNIKQATGLAIIKALGIATEDDVRQAEQYKDTADYFLFDTKSETLGGSSQAFDHRLLNAYTLSTPFLLSGGIGPENREEVISIRHPQFMGIDLNSKFELSPGLKSVSKLEDFLLNINHQ